jgi:hypothetical protein
LGWYWPTRGSIRAAGSLVLWALRLTARLAITVVVSPASGSRCGRDEFARQASAVPAMWVLKGTKGVWSR